MKKTFISIAIISLIIFAYNELDKLDVLCSFFKDNISLLCLSIGIISILLAFYKEIATQIKSIFELVPQHISKIIATCLIIIGFYSFFVKINIVTVFYLLSGLLLLLLGTTDLSILFENIRRVKIGSFEIELVEKLKNLKESSEQIEIEEINSSDDIKIISNQILEQYTDYPDPKMAFVKMAIVIERGLRDIAQNNNLQSTLPFRRLIDMLFKNELIDQQTYALIRDFWPLRNQIVHGQDVSFSLDMLEIGSRILSILQNKFAIIGQDSRSA